MLRTNRTLNRSQRSYHYITISSSSAFHAYLSCIHTNYVGFDLLQLFSILYQCPIILQDFQSTFILLTW